MEGEAAIPIDLFVQGAAPAPLKTADDHAKDLEPSNAPTEPSEPAAKSDAAAAMAPSEAGSKRPASDAGDDSPEAESDSAPADARNPANDDDAALRPEASTDAGVGGPVEPEAGAVSRAPRDPEGIVGAVGAIQADVVLVMVVVNAEVIRATPVGGRLGVLLRALPQWDDFMNGTAIDPVRDVDWMMISGPSLLSTSRDVVLIHYSAADAVVDRAIAVLGRRSGHEGTIDAGARGVRAVLAHADRADRVILRTQAHVVAVVPPAVAQKIARQLVASPVPAHVRPGEAFYLRLVDPHHPMPEIPAELKELRLRVVPRDDGGADAYVEGDTADADVASQAADELRRVIRRHDDAITSLVTGGILDHVEVATSGSHVELHLAATRAQIERLAELAGDLLGVGPEPTTAPARGLPVRP